MIDAILDFLRSNIRIFIVIAVILIIAYVLQKISARLVKDAIRKTSRPELYNSKRDEKLREETIIRIVNASIKVIIWTFAVLLVLAQLNINLGPLIAGAGIAGVALGFGAQSLVKDMINGMFILLENQYRVGDVVEFNKEVSGTVEKFTLRSTTLRDLDGMVHTVPNGEILLATNMTMDYANVNLNIGVDYDTDIEQLEKIVNDVGDKLAADQSWKEKITEAPQFVRINDFQDSAIEIKIVGKTLPVQQWAVTGELRKRLKIAFDKNGIDIPYPQRVIHQSKENSKTNKK